MEEKETLHKKSKTSFGKLILADEKTAPQFSKNKEFNLSFNKISPSLQVFPKLTDSLQEVSQ